MRFFVPRPGQCLPGTHNVPYCILLANRSSSRLQLGAVATEMRVIRNCSQWPCVDNRQMYCSSLKNAAAWCYTFIAHVTQCHTHECTQAHTHTHTVSLPLCYYSGTDYFNCQTRSHIKFQTGHEGVLHFQASWTTTCPGVALAYCTIPCNNGQHCMH